MTARRSPVAGALCEVVVSLNHGFSPGPWDIIHIDSPY